MRNASKINSEAKNDKEQGRTTIATFGASDLDDGGVARLLQQIVDLNPSTICEVGFKVGDNLVSLNNLLPEAKIHGIEFDPVLIQYANVHNDIKNTEITVEAVYGIDSLNHKDKYDVVFCHDLIGDLNDNEKSTLLDKINDLGVVVFVEEAIEMSKEQREALQELSDLGQEQEELNKTESVENLRKIFGENINNGEISIIDPINETPQEEL
jgi:2-polyprenyl-3-methyl-5-hydroxy-6-metoxy-1,4-benzoquinol methylase